MKINALNSAVYALAKPVSKQNTNKTTGADNQNFSFKGDPFHLFSAYNVRPNITRGLWERLKTDTLELAGSAYVDALTVKRYAVLKGESFAGLILVEGDNNDSHVKMQNDSLAGSIGNPQQLEMRHYAQVINSASVREKAVLQDYTKVKNLTSPRIVMKGHCEAKTVECKNLYMADEAKITNLANVKKRAVLCNNAYINTLNIHASCDKNSSTSVSLHDNSTLGSLTMCGTCKKSVYLNDKSKIADYIIFYGSPGTVYMDKKYSEPLPQIINGDFKQA